MSEREYDSDLDGLDDDHANFLRNVDDLLQPLETALARRDEENHQSWCERVLPREVNEDDLSVRQTNAYKRLHLNLMNAEYYVKRRRQTDETGTCTTEARIDTNKHLLCSAATLHDAMQLWRTNTSPVLQLVSDNAANEDTDEKPQKAYPWQQLHDDIEIFGRSQGFVINNDNIYRPKFPHPQKPNFVYVFYMKIADWINHLFGSEGPFSKDLNRAKWSLGSSARVRSELVNSFMTCTSSLIPRIRRHRRIHAFKNCVYLTAHPINHTRSDGTSHIAYEDILHYYDSDDVPEPLQTLIAQGFSAVKYHDYDFIENRIDALDQITEAQFEPDIKKWLYFALGRCLHPVSGDLCIDNFQFCLYLYGLARTGKSTILENLLTRFFDNEDIFPIANEIESVFGLMGSLNEDGSSKFLGIGGEIGKDFRLPKTDFQQMASGNVVTIRGKNLSPVSLQWSAPIVLAGNYVPSYNDNQGEFSRRLLIFYLRNAITEVDNTLNTRLREQVPAILVHVNRVFLEVVNVCQLTRQHDLEKHLPDYFRDMRTDIIDDEKTLSRFLASDKLEFHPISTMQAIADYETDHENDVYWYISWTEFQRLYRQFCKDEFGRYGDREKIGWPEMQAAAAKRNLKTTRTLLYGHTKRRDYIRGVRAKFM